MDVSGFSVRTPAFGSTLPPMTGAIEHRRATPGEPVLLFPPVAGFIHVRIDTARLIKPGSDEEKRIARAHALAGHAQVSEKAGAGGMFGPSLRVYAVYPVVATDMRTGAQVKAIHRYSQVSSPDQLKLAILCVSLRWPALTPDLL